MDWLRLGLILLVAAGSIEAQSGYNYPRPDTLFSDSRQPSSPEGSSTGTISGQPNSRTPFGSTGTTISGQSGSQRPFGGQQPSSTGIFPGQPGSQGSFGGQQPSSSGQPGSQGPFGGQQPSSLGQPSSQGPFGGQQPASSGQPSSQGPFGGQQPVSSGQPGSQGPFGGQQPSSSGQPGSQGPFGGQQPSSYGQPGSQGLFGGQQPASGSASGQPGSQGPFGSQQPSGGYPSTGVPSSTQRPFDGYPSSQQPGAPGATQTPFGVQQPSTAYPGAEQGIPSGKQTSFGTQQPSSSFASIGQTPTATPFGTQQPFSGYPSTGQPGSSGITPTPFGSQQPSGGYPSSQQSGVFGITQAPFGSQPPSSPGSQQPGVSGVTQSPFGSQQPSGGYPSSPQPGAPSDAQRPFPTQQPGYPSSGRPSEQGPSTSFPGGQSFDVSRPLSPQRPGIGQQPAYPGSGASKGQQGFSGISRGFPGQQRLGGGRAEDSEQPEINIASGRPQGRYPEQGLSGTTGRQQGYNYPTPKTSFERPEQPAFGVPTATRPGDAGSRTGLDQGPSTLQTGERPSTVSGVTGTSQFPSGRERPSFPLSGSGPEGQFPSVTSRPSGTEQQTLNGYPQSGRPQESIPSSDRYPGSQQPQYPSTNLRGKQGRGEFSEEERPTGGSPVGQNRYPGVEGTIGGVTQSPGFGTQVSRQPTSSQSGRPTGPEFPSNGFAQTSGSVEQPRRPTGQQVNSYSQGQPQESPEGSPDLTGFDKPSSPQDKTSSEGYSQSGKRPLSSYLPPGVEDAIGKLPLSDRTTPSFPNGFPTSDSRTPSTSQFPSGTGSQLPLGPSRQPTGSQNGYGSSGTPSSVGGSSSFPSSVVGEPSGVARQPFGVSQQPSGVSRQPSGVSRQPFGVSQPSGVSQQPSGVYQQPSEVSQQPSGVSRQPFGVSKQPSGVSQQPSGVYQQPSGVTQQPSGVSRQPFGVSQQPSGVSQQPFGVSQQSSGGSQQPSGVSRQPIGTENGYRAPGTSSGGSVSGGRQFGSQFPSGEGQIQSGPQGGASGFPISGKPSRPQQFGRPETAGRSEPGYSLEQALKEGFPRRPSGGSSQEPTDLLLGQPRSFDDDEGTLEEEEEGDYSAIPGQPGRDYPILSDVPETSFNCDDQEFRGYYADVETRCQIFHICANNKTYDFICPNGTIFHQENLVCVWWNQFECDTAPSLYRINEHIYDFSIIGAQQTGGFPAPGQEYPDLPEGLSGFPSGRIPDTGITGQGPQRPSIPTGGYPGSTGQIPSGPQGTGRYPSGGPQGSTGFGSTVGKPQDIAGYQGPSGTFQRPGGTIQRPGSYNRERPQGSGFSPSRYPSGRSEDTEEYEAPSGESQRPGSGVQTPGGYPRDRPQGSTGPSSAGFPRVTPPGDGEPQRPEIDGQRPGNYPSQGSQRPTGGYPTAATQGTEQLQGPSGTFQGSTGGIGGIGGIQRPGGFSTERPTGTSQTGYPSAGPQGTGSYQFPSEGTRPGTGVQGFEPALGYTNGKPGSSPGTTGPGGSQISTPGQRPGQFRSDDISGPGSLSGRYPSGRPQETSGTGGRPTSPGKQTPEAYGPPEGPRYQPQRPGAGTSSDTSPRPGFSSGAQASVPSGTGLTGSPQQQAPTREYLPSV